MPRKASDHGSLRTRKRHGLARDSSCLVYPLTRMPRKASDHRSLTASLRWKGGARGGTAAA